MVQTGADICGVVIHDKDNYINTEFVDYCMKQNIVIYDGDDVYNHIDKYRDDLDAVFSNTYPQLIKDDVINLASKGGFNFHAAPLPEYKGVFGFNFAIYNREKEYGVTCHKLSNQFDKGDIVEVVRFTIDTKSITVKELVQKSEDYLFELFKKIYYILADGKPFDTVKQEGGHYYSRKYFEELKKINDTDSEEEIERKIRAFWYPPYEGAYTIINGKKYTLIDEKMLIKVNENE